MAREKQQKAEEEAKRKAEEAERRHRKEEESRRRDEEVKALLAQIAEEPAPALVNAAMTGDVDAVQNMLSEGADPSKSSVRHVLCNFCTCES